MKSAVRASFLALTIASGTALGTQTGDVPEKTTDPATSQVNNSAPSPELPTRLRIGEDGWVSVGARLQPVFIYNNSDLVSDEMEFRMRRARIMVRGDIAEWAGFSIATEVSGANVTLIDSYIHFKPQPATQFFVGRHLNPGTGRQAGTTSAAAMMAIDRPGFSFKNLSYGGRAMTAFATSTLTGTDSGLRMDAQVRDEGVTFWGDHSAADDLHFKYYLGAYDGSSRSPARDEGDLRYSGRAAINFGDDESGFFNSSTYLGRKRTLGFGVSFDAQNRVAIDDATERMVNYRYWSADVFLERPIGPGSVNFEAAYGQLDLDDGEGELRARNAAPGDTLGVSARQAQGGGFFLQGGYYFPDLRVQPWVLYEEWDSDAPGGVGSYNNFRIGATYFARGQNLNFKVGYERTRLDWDPGGDRTSDSVVTGVYLNF